MNGMSDEEVVKHVLRHKTDYYRVLLVERTASVDQIKAAYKKMALKCHPDKNRHAQAAEAFKIVGASHTTLTDATKRRVYDRQGVEGVQRHESGRRPAGGPQQRRHPGAGPYGQYYDGSDFFEQFFRARQAGGGGGGGADGPTININGYEINASLLMFIPIVLFLLLALLLQTATGDDGDLSGGGGGGGMYGGGRRYSSPQNAFSLTPDPEQGMTIQRVTSLYGLEVRYYTTRRWAEVIAARRDMLRAMETEVLRRQQDYLGNRCEAESYRHRKLGRKDAPEVCTEYHRFRKRVG